ncbi:MAG: hypothetical protein ACRDSJ_11220, partial [Rubrobacteraceae bacterium]
MKGRVSPRGANPPKPRQTRMRALGVSLSAIAAVCLLAVVEPVDAAFPGKNGRIVFESNRDGNSEIYSMNPDGSDQRRLTNNPAADNTPTFSPNGKKIAFASDRTDPDTSDFDFIYDIFVMNADGANVRRITNDGDAFNFGPAWSPDGKKLAFTSDLGEEGGRGNYDIFTIDINSGARARVTNNENFDFSPDWSPDGKSIAFESDRVNEGGQRDQEVYTINLNTGAVTNVSQNDFDDYSPSYSPDGERIAFQSCRPAGPGSCRFDEPEETRADFDIFTANVDGSEQVRLTEDSREDIADNYTPSWSPNGKRIAYAVVKDREFVEAEIFTMSSSDGSSKRRLTRNPTASDFGPDWGSRVAATPPPKPKPKPKPKPNKCTIKGTARGDILRGTPGRDVICGFGGDDIIRGLGGNDRLIGGAGDDILFGGPGDDVLLGGPGNDVLHGGPGR